MTTCGPDRNPGVTAIFSGVTHLRGLPEAAFGGGSAEGLQNPDGVDFDSVSMSASSRAVKRSAVVEVSAAGVVDPDAARAGAYESAEE